MKVAEELARRFDITLDIAQLLILRVGEEVVSEYLMEDNTARITREIISIRMLKTEMDRFGLDVDEKSLGIFERAEPDKNPVDTAMDHFLRNKFIKTK